MYVYLVSNYLLIGWNGTESCWGCESIRHHGLFHAGKEAEPAGHQPRPQQRPEGSMGGNGPKAMGQNVSFGGFWFLLWLYENEIPLTHDFISRWKFFDFDLNFYKGSFNCCVMIFCDFWINDLKDNFELFCWSLHIQ